MEPILPFGGPLIPFRVFPGAQPRWAGRDVAAPYFPGPFRRDSNARACTNFVSVVIPGSIHFWCSCVKTILTNPFGLHIVRKGSPIPGSGSAEASTTRRREPHPVVSREPRIHPALPRPGVVSGTGSVPTRHGGQPGRAGGVGRYPALVGHGRYSAARAVPFPAF